MAKRRRKDTAKSEDLREQVLDHFSELRIALSPEELDGALSRAEKDCQSYLEFLERLMAEQSNGRRERRIERRIREAHFAEEKTLASFDWQFNAKVIDRVQIEALASGDFIRRRENLVFVGQSGIGKSHLVQAIGRQACVLDYRVRYATSAALLSDLTASLADETLAATLRYYSRFDLLIIDEFGFDKIERVACPQAASLLYKVIDARGKHSSTALVTNVDFESWGDYLPDAPLAMAFLDRLVDGAVILKVKKGKSYRARRAKILQKETAPAPSSKSNGRPRGRSKPARPQNRRDRR